MTVSVIQQESSNCLPLTCDGLTWLNGQSGSLHSFPFGHASARKTMPLACVATGLGCEYGHRLLVHPTPNLQISTDVGASGNAVSFISDLFPTTVPAGLALMVWSPICCCG